MGVGLDIPLPMAAQLIQARRVTTFEGRVIVKGFCAMLILNKVLEASQTFVWHLMTKESGEYISYQESNLNGPLPSNIGKDKAFLTKVVQDGRHIIGWCREAQSLAGEHNSAGCVR